MQNWQGKVVVVTGGSAGLGRAIAEAFARRGCKVVLVARDESKLNAAAAELARQTGAQVEPIAADITSQADVDRLLSEVERRFGQLDVLVNNAGRAPRGALLHTDAEAFRRLLDLNVVALVRCTVAALPLLLKSKGHLVNIGSLSSKSAARYMGAYAASKFAVAAYSQQLRLELADTGLHVLLVCPGPIARDEPREYPPEELIGLPDTARLPGAGVKVSRLKVEQVAEAVVRGCERRAAEIILPGKARLLFVINQLSPKLGDWIVRRMT